MAATERDADARTDVLTDLPPSALVVYHVLRDIGPATQAELIDESYLQRATCQDGLRRLEEAGLIDSQTYAKDARQRLYRLT